jgi:hypothetical protein
MLRNRSRSAAVILLHTLWILRAPLAASVVRGIGELGIKHLEAKHPGKLYVAEADVENQRSRK